MEEIIGCSPSNLKASKSAAKRRSARQRKKLKIEKLFSQFDAIDDSETKDSSQSPEFKSEDKESEVAMELFTNFCKPQTPPKASISPEKTSHKLPPGQYTQMELEAARAYFVSFAAAKPVKPLVNLTYFPFPGRL